MRNKDTRSASLSCPDCKSHKLEVYLTTKTAHSKVICCRECMNVYGYTENPGGYFRVDEGTMAACQIETMKKTEGKDFDANELKKHYPRQFQK